MGDMLGREGLFDRVVAAAVRGLCRTKPPEIRATPWSGEPPPASLLVLQDDGGAGDALCLARYLPLLDHAGYRVVFRCVSSSGLGRLFRDSFEESDWPFVGPRYSLSMMLLPTVFDGQTVPRQARQALHKPRLHCRPYVPPSPYLHADPARVAHYRKRVPQNAVGLCWASGRGWLRMQPIKSMPLQDMEPIWSRYPCVSLQVGQDRAQLAGTPVFDVLPARPDWAEAAALVGALRCVVCVDTGVAHLAGALGADVHLALHMEPTPYWKVGGVDSPWYPRVRVYQGRHWAPVIARIAAALGQGASPAVSHSS
jgi:Glycosyltransferase family 9 (heptosyltransferase)